MNYRALNLALLVACVVTLMLCIAVGLEDHEYWGILQFVSYTLVSAVLGAVATGAAKKLLAD